ncbi:MAG: class I SAM-dependent methyltransferase [Acidobacteriota bacterium]|nr:class I SAM-dependent methyltransferase [Acidobacteriota bacterium]MDH3528989.1 class I SAM-dependent methyltransferase [Acidobacteriota bacterium]
MQNNYVEALNRNQDSFGLDLSAETIEKLDLYYRLVLEHNPLLHLVGKCSDEEFAVRHILESIFLLTLTGKSRTFADVGTGAGLPGIPCLVASENLRGFLIESKAKKSRFLANAVERLEIGERCTIINRQFSEIKKPNAGVVVSRALDKLSKKIPQLVEWSGRSTLALFAGENVRRELDRLKLEYDAFLIPQSERRFLFLVQGHTKGRRKP